MFSTMQTARIKQQMPYMIDVGATEVITIMQYVRLDICSWEQFYEIWKHLKNIITFSNEDYILNTGNYSALEYYSSVDKKSDLN